MITDFII